MKIAPTDYRCTCGHLPDEHSGKYGRCEGKFLAPQFFRESCNCFAYEKGDE